ncbi:hypothetical protein L228DRAFT_106612 [Xylona heveae TC161]|uniref:Uncharacterized protein n=1 Tax=Xylona heveae (strain CBS 132557 / TC161) TaxID=1328760 RepID=A0A165HAP0_XYLHT|nr:hypothetical protein L228DRAFT_106612 [Xylona heveae TC161]KZF23222.1 hypothetical protein L228DRAFT_106612 [Xylona heveae TC161]
MAMINCYGLITRQLLELLLSLAFDYFGKMDWPVKQYDRQTPCWLRLLDPGGGTGPDNNRPNPTRTPSSSLSARDWQSSGSLAVRAQIRQIGKPVELIRTFLDFSAQNLRKGLQSKPDAFFWTPEWQLDLNFNRLKRAFWFLLCTAITVPLMPLPSNFRGHLDPENLAPGYPHPMAFLLSVSK